MRPLELCLRHLRPGAAGALLLVTASGSGASAEEALRYPIVDTGQGRCYSEADTIPCPGELDPWSGQDAMSEGRPPSYVDNRDGTISDAVTGLMWTKSRGRRMAWEQTSDAARACRTGGHDDWRVPSVKELYSIIKFDGRRTKDTLDSRPFLDPRYFDFTFARPPLRPIDVQEWSSTHYVGLTMHGADTAFGVNFADGRIKGYPTRRRDGSSTEFYCRFVRGNPDYGKNRFQDNRDSTITDLSTGLTWDRGESRQGLDWPHALAWVAASNQRRHRGHDDWRLPNAKELQSIVDYGRAPGALQESARGPALDPVFDIALVEGPSRYGSFWTSTTLEDGPPDQRFRRAVTIAFGLAMGWMEEPPQSGHRRLLDVHGAGAQRADFKTGDPEEFPFGFGPQGDVVEIRNHVRLVRGGESHLGAPANGGR